MFFIVAGLPFGLILNAVLFVFTEICQQPLGGSIKFHTDIHGPQRMKPAEFVDPLTFPVTPPAGQGFAHIF